MPAPVVSIVVPTLERPQALATCLDSIEATVDLPHEVLCVSVEHDEATQALLAERAVRNIVQPGRGGAVQAMNLGFRAATGVYLTQINDDSELMPHTIANAVRFLEAPAHGRIGLAAFFHNSPVRRNVYAQVQVEDEWYYVCHVRGLCYANFGLARRALYEELDYFDERFFMYGADPDFSLRVWHEARLEVAPCPGALVRHEQMDDERARVERERQEQDNGKLFAKWRM